MFAATFPGQGSQSIGMLSDLSRACVEVRSTFGEASQALGYDLWKLVREGPEQRLNATEQTQPAMLAAGVAAWRCWAARGGPGPGVAAGHSLGEYSALVAFGALDFMDAVRTVAARGRFMQEAVPEGQGGIAAVIGLDDEAVVELCDAVRERAGLGHVSAVNFNAPGQVAIAGTSRAIDAAIREARDAGAKRAIRLPMSVPVHCPLMAPATARLEATLAAIPVKPPAVPVLHNVDIASRSEEASIRDALSPSSRARCDGAIPSLRCANEAQRPWSSSGRAGCSPACPGASIEASRRCRCTTRDLSTPRSGRSGMERTDDGSER